MLLDILIGVPILIFILLGLRDGVVRKFVAIIVLIAGLILGQNYMHAVGKFLIGQEGASSSDAPMYGFLIIFLGLFIVQALLYKIITRSYKIGGSSRPYWWNYPWIHRGRYIYQFVALHPCTFRFSRSRNKT